MKPLPPLRQPWTLCIGSDRLSTMLRAEYWEHFDTVQAALGIRYLRCHGLLGDELGVVQRDEWEGRTRLKFNFTALDQIFDRMLAHRVRPLVEWGFMPEALASGSQTVFWWKGNVTPPRSWDEWALLVTSLTRHWVDRYGLFEVRSWFFEVWNEPNLPNFWEGADQEAYFTLYEVTVGALRAVDSQLKVGGPAICGGSDSWIEAFLGFVARKGLPLDFFSRHLYAAHAPHRVTPDLYYQTLTPPEVPRAELEEVRRRIDAAGFPQVPLYITEFNTSYHPQSPVHDTPLNAAHLAGLLSRAGEWADLMSYWTFCDVFEETGVPRAPFFGGFGLLAQGGIPKPTFHLLTFFRRLGSVVQGRDDHSLVTWTDRGAALLAWNPVAQDMAGVQGPLRLGLDWAQGRALVCRRRVHDGAANPWALWNRLGRPRYPDAATVELLRQAAVPQIEVTVVDPADGRLELVLDLEPNEVTLVEVTEFVDEGPSYWGLDDALILENPQR